MKAIELAGGAIALVDDADFEWLNQFRWYRFKHRNTIYARRIVSKFGKSVRYTFMHREILALDRSVLVDHRDGDGLHNQRKNLRQCSNQENSFNQGVSKSNTSGYKGVTWHKFHRRWIARIRVNGKIKSLGTFMKPEQAAHAYDAAARELFGEFARPNFPMCVDCATDSNGGQQPTQGGPG